MDKLNDYIKQLYTRQSYIKGGDIPDKPYVPQYFPEKNDEVLIDEVGKYSISKPYITQILIKLIKKNIRNSVPLSMLRITDGTASIGGDTLAFSKEFQSVNSVEFDKTRFDYLKHNMNLFKRYNITFYNDSYLNLYKKLTQDIIYMDPPWGGPDYKNIKNLTLSLGDRKMDDLCRDIIENKLCKLIILKLPYNYDLSTFNFKYKKYLIKTILFIFINVY